MWNIYPLEGVNYGEHWQPEVKGDLELVADGNQPVRFHIDNHRRGMVVLMQGLAYTNPNNGEKFCYAAVVEDWREVSFIPFISIAEADSELCSGALKDEENSHKYKNHNDSLFCFRQSGKSAYPCTAHD